LLEIGHSQRRAVLIIWLWAGLVAFGAVLVSIYPSGLTWSVLGLWAALTVGLTFAVPRVRRPEEHPSGT
jgi:UDP-GlcNAc:undecaprenyl-phosphate GlcNAc-1-phosphate transferase